MSNTRDPFSRAETQMETPGPLGHQDFASPDKQKNQPSIGSRGPQGVEPDRGRAALEEGRKNVMQALQDLQKFRVELDEKMIAVIKQKILDQYCKSEDESLSPEVKEQNKNKILSEQARALNQQNFSAKEYVQFGRQELPQELVQRHKKLLLDFTNAVEAYIKARQESKQSGGFLPESSKDTLSEYWDWSEELLKEYVVTGRMIGDENLAHNVVLKTSISLVDEASWDAFAIYEKAYMEWSRDKQSPAKKDKLAESLALLYANLMDLAHFDPLNETITEIEKRMQEMDSPSS